MVFDIPIDEMLSISEGLGIGVDDLLSEGLGFGVDLFMGDDPRIGLERSILSCVVF